MDNLSELIAKVEALTGPDRLTDANILWAFKPEEFEADAGEDDEHLKPSYCYARSGWTMNRADRHYLNTIPVPAYTASLDAAVALVERLKPGWSWYVRVNITADGDERYANAQVWPPSDPRDEEAPHHWANAHEDHPALALILALLKALRSPNG